MSYAQGNVIKYITRYNVKSKDVDLQIQDLQKAKWYLEDLIKELEKTNSHRWRTRGWQLKRRSNFKCIESTVAT